MSGLKAQLCLLAYKQHEYYGSIPLINPNLKQIMFTNLANMNQPHIP